MTRTDFLLLAIVLPLGLASVAGVVAVARHNAPPDTALEPSRAATVPASRPYPPAVSAPAWGGPSPAKEGHDWNHRELFEYLKSRGVDCYYRSKGGLTVVCGENATPEEREFIDAVAQDSSLLNTKDLVFVQKHSTAESAKDHAGTLRHAFSWGRFLFKGPDDQLDRFRAALGVQ